MDYKLGVHISVNTMRAYYFIIRTDDDGTKWLTWLGDAPPDQPDDARATRAAYNNEQLESFGKTPHPDDPTAPTSTVAAAVAYEAMIEALRDNIDPLMVEVQTDTGLYLRIIQCTIRTIVDGQTMSIFELLKQARMDRQDEILAQREEIENLETDDWSM